MITTEVGHTVDVDLASTPTTGYRWYSPALPAGLELTGAVFTPAPGGQPGDGGAQHFSLRATAPGRYRLEFVLRRPWESAPAATRVVDVEVVE
ncbi:putative secreted protein [Nocardia transvalensis]|uniref:Putative secreted protein n=1 Tax=Nocardia transvalensis TaxID=37333 RepID=A0A7W9UM62_9NOCA|nr:protease inhibitor I42 family protein [Nocardia transvalensis]MBB5918289.1 putative secreted protein [Nocardia transvalensis]